MRNLVERLTPQERRTVLALAAAAAVGAAVFLFVLVRERPAAARLDDRLLEIQRDHQRLSPSWVQSKTEAALWAEAVRDMEELKTTRFYSEAKGFQDLRPDLQALFDAAGVAVSDITFGYTDFPREGLRRVTADFVFGGSYAALKVFLDRVERQPRFLYVEKIDFLNIGLQPGLLELKITMAGYYER